jgi:hypothetical protein
MYLKFCWPSIHIPSGIVEQKLSYKACNTEIVLITNELYRVTYGNDSAFIHVNSIVIAMQMTMTIN